MDSRIISFRSLGERKISMNTRFPFNECNDGHYIVYLKGISEKLEWILQSDITENERR